MIVERTNYLSKIIDAAPAKRFSAMRAGILNGIKSIPIMHHANPLAIDNH
jgi:hypothetical protein